MIKSPDAYDTYMSKMGLLNSRISNLEAENATLKEVMRWKTKDDDGMPQLERGVLVLDDGWIQFGSFYDFEHGYDGESDVIFLATASGLQHAMENFGNFWWRYVDLPEVSEEFITPLPPSKEGVGASSEEGVIIVAVIETKMKKLPEKCSACELHFANRSLVMCAGTRRAIVSDDPPVKWCPLEVWGEARS